MSRILITGSTDGLGLLAAKSLISRGHTVTLHARSPQRAQDALSACPGASKILTADLSLLSETKSLAQQINTLDRFDCIIHNAGLFRGAFRKTIDGIPALAAVNTIAPYVISAALDVGKRPKRMLFLTSDRHRVGDETIADPLWVQRGEGKWDEVVAYSDSKLHNVLFARGFARRWPECKVNVMNLGWVPTKMTGWTTKNDLETAVMMYVMMAEGEEGPARESGGYVRAGREGEEPKVVEDEEEVVERLFGVCEGFSGVKVV